MENEKTMNFQEPEKNVGIVIDDGTEEVPITNLRGQRVGVFYVRPTDIGIVHRYNDFVKKFNGVLEPVQQVNLNSDGSAKDGDDRTINALREAEKRLSDALNTLFDGNFAEAFFGKMNPFSIVGGRFYCEIAIEAVGAYIQKRFDREMNLAQNRVDKYTHGYRTGKHRNGGKRRGRGPQQ